MSREIKFRVWEKRNKRMIHDCTQFNIENGSVYQMLFWGNIKVNLLSSEFTLMQYTGLKDKNGVEIYEGDIIKLSYGIPPTYDILFIEYADDEYVSDISVSGWWMRNKRKNGCSSSLCKTYENDIEVVGTIHENPELLKGN